MEGAVGAVVGAWIQGGRTKEVQRTGETDKRMRRVRRAERKQNFGPPGSRTDASASLSSNSASGGSSNLIRSGVDDDFIAYVAWQGTRCHIAAPTLVYTAVKT